MVMDLHVEKDHLNENHGMNLCILGVNESPLMTWGEIEGTPFRLDASDTPVSHTPGPTFKIPQIPNRDRLAHKLAEDASKAHRSKKQDALKRFSALAGSVFHYSLQLCRIVNFICQCFIEYPSSIYSVLHAER